MIKNLFTAWITELNIHICKQKHCIVKVSEDNVVTYFPSRYKSTGLDKINGMV